MEELLEEFICSITKENRTITLTYCHPTYSHLTDDGGLTPCTGYCEYHSHTMKGLGKPINQNFVVMTKCDMGDIIEYINQKRGLTENDFNEVNKLIREHTRVKAESVVQDPHQ